VNAMVEPRLTAPASARRAFDAATVRADFPILERTIHGKPLVFLDSAASAQKPQAVIDAGRHCYEAEYANIHRGVYYLSQRATENFEAAREKVRAFLGAGETREIVFVRNATEAINLVAQTYGRSRLKAGDEIVLSHIEHHSNIVPWQMLRDDIGVVIKVAPVNDAGEIELDAVADLLGPRTKIIAITQMSNALGTITPIREIIGLARARGITVLVDGCQAVPHLPVNVTDLDCDFYVFSGHKLYGPSGIGVLYGKAELLEAMPPYQGGGEMITSVTFEETKFAALPHKFEAGTPHIAGAIGLGAAIDYLGQFDFAAIEAHEQDLLRYATARLGEINSVRLIGTAADKGAILSFTLEGIHPHDIGTIVDHEGVAVRAGHHCAQPTMDRFGVAATVRASFGIYNTRSDADALIASIGRVLEVFAG
jgi:cysteine desulfurase/selenocysteine lyase